MLVHSVYFWLKEDLSPDDVAAFREGLESLRGIEAVRDLHIGMPAATAPRPVIDTSYTFGLVVVLDDLAAQDVYQAHPLHQAFVERFRECWHSIRVYDFD